MNQHAVGKSAAKFAVVLFLAAPFSNAQTTFTLPDRIALARPLLLQAEASSSAADPAARTFLLYRAAGAWLDLDLPHAIELYHQAFAAARLIDSRPLRDAAQHDILSDLLPLSPAAALELVPQADPSTQGKIYTAIIHFSLLQRDVPEAIKAFEQASAGGIFSERGAMHLMAVSNATDRDRIFRAAMSAFQAQKPEESHSWTASKLVARYWQDLPRASVLSGIEVILDVAEQKDKQQPIGSGGISYGDHSLSYKSRSDLELFAVAPALKALDPAHAAQLLEAHPAVQEYLRRFPGGLSQFDTTFSYANNTNLGTGPSIPFGRNSYASDKGAHSTGLSPLDMGLEFTIPMDLRIGLGVTGSLVYFANPGSPEGAILGEGNTCPPDVPRLLAKIDTVPFSRRVPTTCSGPNGAWCSYSDHYPRVDVVNNLAERCTYYPGKDSAITALAEELRLVEQLPPSARPEYLVNAADLYLRLGDRKAAADAVRSCFEVAASLFAKDAQSDQFKSLPKAVWPSAEVYRRMISLGVNADFEMTRTAVETIQDKELRELERVMMARSLLGIPVRRQIIFYANSSMMMGSEPGYENL